MNMDKPTSRLRSSLSSVESILLFNEYCLEYRLTVVWRVILGERERSLICFLEGNLQTYYGLNPSRRAKRKIIYSVSFCRQHFTGRHELLAFDEGSESESAILVSLALSLEALRQVLQRSAHAMRHARVTDF
jgi:hypothetical protein